MAIAHTGELKRLICEFVTYMYIKKKIEGNRYFCSLYGIFYELWTFVDFDRLCKLENRGNEILKKSSPLKLLSQSPPNCAEMILGWSPSKIVSSISDLQPRSPPQPNLI
jgi:hypothetical protein